VKLIQPYFSLACVLYQSSPIERATFVQLNYMLASNLAHISHHLLAACFYVIMSSNNAWENW